MMKLAYRVCIVTLILFTFVFAVSAQVIDNDLRSVRDDRNTAPTVGTGGPVGGPTGLFTVYDGQTLRKGEFTFSAAYSNYDRDPGNADFVEVPVSFQVGVTNNFELFFNTDAYRAVKVNAPQNLSGFYLPNSRLRVGNSLLSGGAIVLAPSGPGSGIFENRAVFRPAGTAPFVQFPFIGGSAGTFGLNFPFFSGPIFGFPAGTTATLGPSSSGGNGADNFPGIGSVFGSILPGFALQTVCTSASAGTNCSPAATSPTVFTLAPTYLPDAPFINRTYGESAFNTFTVGGKVRFTDIDSSIGVGLVGFYRFYADDADDFSGFNQLQRGASPGSGGITGGDFGLTLFADARLARWANLSANIGYHYNRSVKSDLFGNNSTILDRPDELLGSLGLDFPVNRYFQPILEFRTLQYVGGRTPNAFENHPMDGLAGFRVFPARWFGLGFAYRYHFNQQDSDSFDDEDSITNTVSVTCPVGQVGCVPRTISNTFRGIPTGFQTSSDPHGFIVQVFAGRRDERQGDILNIPANVTNLTLSDTEIRLPCPAGTTSTSGSCNDSTSVTVATTATDVENDVLTYNYTVSGGRIVGTGANVQWDLSGSPAGTYTITAGVDDGCGLCGQTQTRTITIAECGDCRQVCECPSVSVSGPAGITAPGDTMTFTANVSGGSQPSVTYNWSVSAGDIESGQGTPSITVRVPTDMADGNITATVTISGPDPACNCPLTDDEVGGVSRPVVEPVLVDEFGRLSNDDVRSRLDAFFVELQNNPNNQGYIINYGTDREITARERLITNHINLRRFDRTRITLVRGGDTGSGVNTKLYRIPPGATNPTP